MRPAARLPRPNIPALVALALLGLTAIAVLWPQRPAPGRDGTFLVLAPDAGPRRVQALTALAGFLEERGHAELRLEVVADREAFAAALPGALLALCPDGVSLALPSASWRPLATGRRRVPWNLRPVSVLVSRLGAPGGDRPWLTAPGRTAFGDSLSLVCLAPLCGDDGMAARPAGVTWGSDPYDHRVLVAAAAYGAFDHVVARQWDVAAAQAAGILAPDRWQVRRLSDPVPDVVVLGATRLSRAVRLDLQQALTVLGRESGDQTPEQAAVRAELGQLGLDGFNLLLAPDFDRIRRRFSPCWPGTLD